MSIIINDCYSSIVGLSRTLCQCYDIPSDASDSLSGLYIDELESLSAINSIVNCDNNQDLFEQLYRARESAIISFQADVNALMMQTFKLKRDTYKGGIGRATSKQNINQITGNYYGIRIYCDNVRSGMLHIKSIGALFSNDRSFDIYIYNNLGELVDSETIITQSNVLKQNPVDIELPLHNDYADYLQYFIIYQLGDPGYHALGNDLICGCDHFKANFDLRKPYFNNRYADKKYDWAQWIMVGGYASNHLVPIIDDCLIGTANNLMYGLTLEVELKCKYNEVLCKDQLDFETNNLAGAMAIAIQHKAAQILGLWIIKSGNLSRWNMINGEQIVADIDRWGKTYADMVTFIATNADISTNDCLECRDVWEMAKHGIFS